MSLGAMAKAKKFSMMYCKVEASTSRYKGRIMTPNAEFLDEFTMIKNEQ